MEKLKVLTTKGVDVVAIIAFNDGWVMSAWAKINRANASDLLFLGDTKSLFSKHHGWDAGMGDRNGRWAMVIGRDGVVKYAENEADPTKVTVSGVDEVLAKL